MITATPAPLLVTGLPRSGTTWLAQQLAGAHGASLPGREPMNPRGRQFALQGSLPGWTRMERDLTGLTRTQLRTLRRVYRGWEPRVYSRYGIHQWAAPLPWVRLVVKDPFALLSLPGLTRVTGARPIIVYRHPAALLASYRRMGWRPDVAEIRALGLPGHPGHVPPRGPGDTGDIDEIDETDDVAAMAWFWATCYATVLHDLPGLPGAVVVNHAELARGGDPALGTLAAAVGLRDVRARPRSARLVRREWGGGAAPPLHDLGREPSAVAEAWREHVDAGEVTRIEVATSAVLEELSRRRIQLPVSGATNGQVVT